MNLYAVAISAKRDFMGFPLPHNTVVVVEAETFRDALKSAVEKAKSGKLPMNDGFFDHSISAAIEVPQELIDKYATGSKKSIL